MRGRCPAQNYANALFGALHLASRMPVFVQQDCNYAWVGEGVNHFAEEFGRSGGWWP
jgi:hypothetical protein